MEITLRTNLDLETTKKRKVVEIKGGDIFDIFNKTQNKKI